MDLCQEPKFHYHDLDMLQSYVCLPLYAELSCPEIVLARNFPFFPQSLLETLESGVESVTSQGTSILTPSPPILLVP